MIRSTLPALACLSLLALAGCQGDEVSRTFGITRDAPDEFSVTTRAPLSMPPDYALRPPRPGALRPQEQSARRAAEGALVPQAALQGAGQMTPGQQALIQAAGRPAPADIRTKLDEDAALVTTDRPFTDRLLFWRAPPAPGTVVDPTREAQRLRENAALGQGPQAGDTPIIQRKAKTFFDIF